MKNAFGPLYDLYSDTSITEIFVDAPDNIYYEKKGKLLDSKIKFKSADELNKTIYKIFALAGRKITKETLNADIRLSDGSQVMAILTPMSMKSSALFIKRMPSQELTWNDVIKFGCVDKKTVELLKKFTSSFTNILHTGNTGSGKTTTANLLINSIPEQMRVISVEENLELILKNKRGIRLEASKEMPLEKLVPVAAKMLPDYLIVTELKNAESLSVIQAMRAGWATIATTHSEGITDALARLELMCMMANIGIGINEIRSLIASTIKIVTYQEKMSDGVRRITEIAEVVGLENNRYMIVPLMKYDQKKKKFIMMEAAKKWL